VNKEFIAKIKEKRKKRKKKIETIGTFFNAVKEKTH